MKIETILAEAISKGLNTLYSAEVAAGDIKLESTKKDFEGDYTFVVFPYLRVTKKGPEQSAEELGNYLKENVAEVTDFNVVKGFLNLVIADSYWTGFLTQEATNTTYGKTQVGKGKKVMVEYSSPNTNKPLHLGHIRNNLLGYSVAEVLAANGYEVIKANLVNDRGIHICKSMIAWQKFGGGETPESSGMKGDHLVGKYYVVFDKEYKKEIDGLVLTGMDKEQAEKSAPLMLQAQEMLRKWEAGDEEVVNLWKTMNGWVYAGFDKTYERMGVNFDQYYYESDTYLLGKNIVNEGLEKGTFYKKEDGSVWADLTDVKLDHKLLLRADGTSVYMTQDIGTADLKYSDYHTDKSIYVVGNEQDYHFKVLFEICKRMGKPYAEGMFHLSYGMVDLPSGKMKSREGTVVDADDLMDEMHATAKKLTEDLGKTEGFTEEEMYDLYETIGFGALKYYLLKVDPQRRMMFNPEESVDFQGHTGPFIQYTHARIKSVLRNADATELNTIFTINALQPAEKDILVALYKFPAEVEEAGKNYSPALIANYIYEVAKLYNTFYHEHSVLKEEDKDTRVFRLQLCQLTAQVISYGLQLLGIKAPERM